MGGSLENPVAGKAVDYSGEKVDGNNLHDLPWQAIRCRFRRIGLSFMIPRPTACGNMTNN
jgi:hypothetical protein